MARSVAILSSMALLAILVCAHAGDATPKSERKEFHQSATYPYIFEPVNYLVNQGPAPMRYGLPSSDGGPRQAPALPKVEKTKLIENTHPTSNTTPEKPADDATVTSAASTAGETAPKTDAPAPAYPAPPTTPESVTTPEADFNKTPDEVVGYFRNPYNFVPDSHRFFDPIFEPAQMQKGPPSKAVYKITK